VKRREFIALVGGAAGIWQLVWGALAQERPRISILHSGFPNRTPINLLFEALRTLGYEHGRTATIELHGAEGNSGRLSVLAGQLATGKPNVIIGLTSPAARALKQAGVTTPVVFAFVSDPVGQGIVESLARPGANFTGVTYSDAVLGGKRLEFLIDALPGTKRVAVLWSRLFPENISLFESIAQSAPRRGIEIVSRELRGAEDLTLAFEDSARAGAQGVIFLTDNTMFGHRKEIAELALVNRLPSIHSFPPEARDGGLMSFGPNLDDAYRRAADLADRVLKGAQPANMPVEEPTRFELVINLKTAKALGLEVPPSLLARADEVIE
jgi:putative tryptophan/tyrosine transport system substrate-binding protein